jgi:hypothetical protein
MYSCNEVTILVSELQSMFKCFVYVAILGTVKLFLFIYISLAHFSTISLRFSPFVMPFKNR